MKLKLKKFTTGINVGFFKAEAEFGEEEKDSINQGLGDLVVQEDSQTESTIVVIEELEVIKEVSNNNESNDITSPVNEQKPVSNKPKLYVAGETDVYYINTAISLLGKGELATKIDIAQYGESTKMGGINTGDLVFIEAIHTALRCPEVDLPAHGRLFLVDPDANKITGDSLRKNTVVKKLHFSNKVIKKGIESLFPEKTVKKLIRMVPECFEQHKIKVGISEWILNVKILEDKKRFLCDYICRNCKPDDFVNFSNIFGYMDELLELR